MATVTELTMAELIEAAESWGPFPIPACTLNAVELASIGFSCYGMIQQLVMLSTKIGVKMIGDRKLKRASSGSETYPIFNFNKS